MAYNFKVFRPAESYESVRHLMGLDSTIITNELILDPEIGEAAEKAILKQFARYIELTDEDHKALLRSAIVRKVCAELCEVAKVKYNPSFRIRSVQFGGQRIDWDKRKKDFERDVESKLSQIPLYNESVNSAGFAMLVSGPTSAAKKAETFVGHDYTDPIGESS